MSPATLNNPTPEQLHIPTFGEGFTASTRAIFVLLKTPSLLLLTLLALFVNGLVIGGLLWWGWSESNALLPWLQKHLGFAAVGFTIFKWLILVLLLYFVLPIVFSILLNLNPISAFLASKMFQIVFKQETGQTLPETDPLLTSIAKLIWSEGRKLLAMLTLMIIALLFNLIPVVGSIASAFLLIMINVQFSGWSYVTPYYEALGYNYASQRKAMTRQNKAIWGVGIVAAIPILNFLAIFFGPIGGAILTAKVHQHTTQQLNA